ncbi:hypothetical protein U27_04219 [Candidatus Vecturithrix granuli]|uniref:O-antigen ligase-related domain-containing protein n=1 Tax=Vecturithrix granuli TaxID=1499967 RepID=A0A081BY49_VECG1|nr:hypothetical protein U27_04219 [Candidatus Vecturithrix granuli]
MYEKIIEIGIILLLIYTPLAFGGVVQGSVALMELVIGLLMLVWLAKLVTQRQLLRSPGSQGSRRRKRYQLVLYTPSFLPLLVLFVLLIFLQLTPLPGFLIKWISPAAYRLYADAAGNIGVPIPVLLPLTVCTQATETGLYQLLAYCALFLLMINNIRSPRQIRRIVLVIVAVGCFEAFYGLFEYFSGRHHIFWHQKQSSLTVSGTFVNKNHFAGYMEMVIPLMFSVLFTHLGEHKQTATKKIVRFLDEKYMKTLLVSFFLFIMIGSLLLSGSRGGIISFVGGMASLLILAYHRRLLRKWIALILILGLLSAGLAVPIGWDLILSRFQTLADLTTEQSFQFRQEVWKGTLYMFGDFPVLGTGLGTFARIFPQYQTFPSDITFFYTENDYLQMLAETGIIGTGLAMWIGAMFFFTTLRAWKERQSRWSIILVTGGISAISSLLLHSCIDFNLHIPSNALLFCVIAAITYVAAHSHRRSIQ